MKNTLLQAIAHFDTTHGVINHTDAFDGNVGLFQWPEWVGYTFGSLFIVIGISIYFLFARKAKEKMLKYKQEQLEEYNKINRRKETNYSRTGMYLPAWEKAKLSAPVMLAVVFVFVGIAWMIGNSLTTL